MESCIFLETHQSWASRVDWLSLYLLACSLILQKSERGLVKARCFVLTTSFMVSATWVHALVSGPWFSCGAAFRQMLPAWVTLRLTLSHKTLSGLGLLQRVPQSELQLNHMLTWGGRTRFMWQKVPAARWDHHCLHFREGGWVTCLKVGGKREDFPGACLPCFIIRLIETIKTNSDLH